jgi:transcriptional regulator with XRE-family HTH domain
MTGLLTPAQIEARAKEAGLSLVELCERAGIALSTFYRWRSGDTEPRLDVYRRLEAASEPPKVAA